MPDIKQVYVDGTIYDIWNTVIIDYGTASSTVWDTIKTAYEAGKNVLLKVSDNQSSTLYYRHFYPLVTYAKFSSTSEIFEFRSVGTLSTIRYTLSKSNNSYSWSNGTVNVAPLDSPTLTGTPKAPTAAAGTNTIQIATTAFVKTAIETEVGEIPTGTFPEMSVGSLISDEKINNNTPYLYRPVLNGVGNRAYSKLIGATIANNQLVTATGDVTSTVNGITFTVSNNKISISGTATANADFIVKSWASMNIPSGHKLVFAIPSFTGVTYELAFSTAASGEGRFYDRYFTASGVVALANTSGAYYIKIRVLSGSTVNISNAVLPQLSDLTQDFGSTIADYAYTLETNEAGAGVAWLKSYGFFSKYAPYDAGSLISTKAEKKKVVGFNLWDEEWEQGSLDGSTGQPSSSNSEIRAKNYIPAFPSTSYFPFVGSAKRLRVCAYDGNKTFIATILPGANSAFSTPANTAFIRFATRDTYGTTYNNNICINLSKTTGTPKNGDYVVYTLQEYDLGSDELKGLFKLDANNNIYAEGDTKVASGLITRTYDRIDLGAQTWSIVAAGTATERFQMRDIMNVAKAPSTNYDVANMICDSLVSATAGRVANDADVVNEIGMYTSGIIEVRYPSVHTAADFKTAMNGKYLVYELATPTTEQGTPFIDPSIVYPNGTEEYIDTRTVPVPVGNETEYSEDLKGGLETILDTPSANGTYVLKATVSGGVATLGWVAQ